MAMGVLHRRSMQLLAVTVVLLALSLIDTSLGENSPGAFQVDLMQYHHEKSPFAKPNLSLQDRVIIAVESSRKRPTYSSQSISGKLQSNSEAVFQDPVYSNEGSYLMEVQLGSPPQNKTAIADTGSDLFWLQCECVSCYPQPDPPYVPKQSSNYSVVNCTDSLCAQLPSSTCSDSGQCEYSYGYGDGSSTQGVLASDVLTLTSSTFTVDFGCGTVNQGTFNNTDGLVGLGQGPLSIISQIGSSFGKVFSYCLVSFYSSPSKTSPLYFGNDNGSYTYTPLANDTTYPTFYMVNATGLLVNNTPLGVPESTFVVDSGTTLTQLQLEAYNPLLKALQSLITYPIGDGSIVGLDLCYTPGVSNPSWPQVTFQFQGLDVALPGDNLFLLVDDNGLYCLAMQGTNLPFGIFGNVQQQNFNIQFDITNSRIGFSAPTTC